MIKVIVVLNAATESVWCPIAVAAAVTTIAVSVHVAHSVLLGVLLRFALLGELADQPGEQVFEPAELIAEELPK